MYNKFLHVSAICMHVHSMQAGCSYTIKFVAVTVAKNLHLQEWIPEDHWSLIIHWATFGDTMNYVYVCTLDDQDKIMPLLI